MVYLLGLLVVLVGLFVVIIKPPALPTETAPSPTVFASPSVSPQLPLTTEFVTIASPHSGEKISSPLIVTGLARGYWYFEATFPVELVASDGQVLARSYATAQADWMTENWVPFTAELRFEHDTSITTGELILRKANASGLPENDDQVVIPITL